MAQTAQSDCGIIESLFTQSGVTIPWTIGSCCGYQATLAPGATSIILAENVFILCSADRVRQVQLNAFPLTATIPDSIATLDAVEVLDFSNCRLTGRIPPVIANLTRLTSLSLTNNRLTDDFPNLLAMTNLKTLMLSGNRLVGNVDGILPPNLQTCSITGTTDGVVTCSNNYPTVCGTLPRAVGCPVITTTTRTTTAQVSTLVRSSGTSTGSPTSQSTMGSGSPGAAPSSPSSPPTPNSADSSGISPALIAVSVVAAILAVALLFFGVFIWKLRRRAPGIV
ncbi:L domain-like protein [Gonapodya prolifera JEL478]|uniref:L domain-like protein n=1 Tax=Gonapodya prolifera (strain JEL478) TaxID=1344416 RepID=A0A139ARY2_GONPJ|nr:L domain-like protein [Gonapodya prolifera JEL478]|eukprot:KXS19492.1 L domain-like protein [Gonapodya prolifera JEL478]